ncbi:MAG: HAMP domain-containing protein [Planctomycetes bacterium]|nr:HAMP domain-containing protein [Planctomycetota bacterium]
MSSGPKKSLRTKIALILTVVVGAYALLDYAVQRWAVLPRFGELEVREGRKDLERVRHAIDGELERVDRRCLEWAAWEETRRFVDDVHAPRDAERQADIDRFLRANFAASEFINARLNLIYVVDRDGKILAGAAFDLKTGNGLTLKDLSLDRIASTHPWLVREKHAADGAELLPDPVCGLSVTEIGPTFLSSRPIPSADGGLPWIGTVILGRRIDDALVANVAERTSVDFQVWDLTGAKLPDDIAAVVDRVTSSPELIVEPRDDQTLDAWATVDDARKIPTLLLRASLPRDISAFGSKALQYALVSTFGAGTLLVFVLLAVLRKVVLAPLARLTEHAVAIGRTDDVSAKLQLRRDDEIGVLSGEFDRMMEKLEHSRAEVVRTARVAGMSEISTGVLHNVGNALNSVNVAVNVISERVRGNKLAKLERVVEMIEGQGDKLGEFITTHPKGKHVAPFLSEVAKLMRTEQDEIAAETHKLTAGVEHLRALVASQQELAGKNELREAVRVEDQIELAATLCDLTRGDGAGPVFDVDTPNLGRVMLDRHKLVQILVNLFKNAREAIVEAETKPGRIRVRVETTAEHLRIVVVDDGSGIRAENLAQIFNHGFTTKVGGHGFGLHSSANAAVEMGGRIEAASEGPGRGSTFTLELPLEIAPHV